MPGRRKSRFGYRTNVRERQQRSIANQTEEERTSANERRRQRMAQMRAERRAAKLEKARLRIHQSSAASDLLPLEQNERLRMAERRQQETEDQRRTGLRAQQSLCPYCKALKFKGEAKGMCCAAEKIKLPRLEEPPEPLKTLLAGYTAESKRFLSKIRKYNSYFQMTSFGAEIVTTQCMPTFKVEGQIYHKAGSLLPLPDGEHKFLQMYFIGDSNDELNARCGIHTDIERSIVYQLQQLFHEKSNLVHLFKTAIDMMPSDTHKIVIYADKTPAGEHVRRFNAPTIDEVAIVIVGDQFILFFTGETINW
ncbi:unnamed protein product [Onchocerca ochengi]|uniref:Helitron_like_N domain-containing protein n=1 Tax=Onchocerca ochengi TaxID=42157 RepID=A0A182EMS6_ONCOC|nr:unnamed protein product [Onchocerca ochengi]